MVRSSTALARTKSGLPFPFTHDEVLERPLRELHLAAHQVDDPHHALVGRAEAQGPALAPRQPEIAAVPVVARRGVTGRRPLPRALVDLLPRARAGVEGAAVPQRLDGGRVRLLLLPTGSTGPRRGPCRASRARR